MTEFRLETERLILRDWREEDWPLFWRHCNTPAVMQWLGGVADEATMAAANDRLEGYRRDHGHTFWVCERKDDGGHLSGEILGFCGLKCCNEENGPTGDVEAGWRLREDAWGKGYAKEAAFASLEAGFEQFDAPHIIALTVQENAPSWGLMKRLGMQRREDLDFESNQFGPESVIVYSITREQWEQTQ
ncbi:GNAT family N-acetyltransferase [Qipengyuania sp. DGS5-3]|uniref:GNAT family N-acetyltransferase n=1 Tax=Qipengyuania sp. DGS5-3 TaxID=3349632 RepID=UPI0036D32577